MRVKYLRDHGDFLKGAVVDLDEGTAADLIEAGTVKEFPRTAKELAEAATKYYPGDEGRTDKQKAERAAQVVPLTGDTRTATEDATGEDDPHVLRAKLDEAAEKQRTAAAKRAAEDEAARLKAEQEARAAAEKDKAKADATRGRS